jgi:2-keto-myo-inositol isomerase
MNKTTIDRRKLLKFFGASAAVALMPDFVKGERIPVANKNFRYCLNAATIRGHKLGMVKELEIISKAGFSGVEIWMDTLQAYLSGGGTTKDLSMRLKDLNLTVENAIGFAEWIVDDDTRRKNGIEQLKKEMDLLAQIGCKRTAAPPAGAVEKAGLNLQKAAERYRTILELGDKTGVIPHLELWGFSANLHKLSEVMFVAVESGHPSAKVLLDNYHLYKGGSGLETLSMLNPGATEVFHMNDYTNIERKIIKDEDRVMPGDGVSPLKKILTTLKNPDKPLVLSVEIFNKKYYAMDALEAAKIALNKCMSAAEGI